MSKELKFYLLTIIEVVLVWFILYYDETPLATDLMLIYFSITTCLSWLIAIFYYPLKTAYIETAVSTKRLSKSFIYGYDEPILPNLIVPMMFIGFHYYWLGLLMGIGIILSTYTIKDIRKMLKNDL